MHADLPAFAEKYAETALFDERTIPSKLLEMHRTKPAVWGRISVIEGTLEYIVPGPPERRYLVTPNTSAVIVPEELHRVTPVGKVQFRVEFHRVNSVT